jgi:hypothetical protein
MQTQEILKKDKKKVNAELQAALDAATALTQTQKKSSGGGSAAQKDSDVVDLQAKLIDLNNRLLDADFELKAVNAQLSSCTRSDEKELLSIKLVVLQVGKA